MTNRASNVATRSRVADAPKLIRPEPPPPLSFYQTDAEWESALAKHFAKPPVILHPLLKLDSRYRDLEVRYWIANHSVETPDLDFAIRELEMMAKRSVWRWQWPRFSDDRTAWMTLLQWIGVREIPSDVIECWFQEANIPFLDVLDGSPRCVHRPSLRDLAFNALALAEPMKVLELPSSLHHEYYRRRAIQQLKAGTMTPEDFAVVMIRLIQGANIE